MRLLPSVFYYTMPSSDRPIWEDLNPEQRVAAFADGICLVYAGPGSGKTRTLTARIARLIHDGIGSERIVTLTFTNRAAREVRERITSFGGAPKTFIGTFHGFGLSVLKRWHWAAGLPADFSIFDADDSLRIIKQILKNRSNSLSPDSIKGEISRRKLAGESPDALSASDNDYLHAVESVWREYEDTLAKNRAVDFDDLIRKTELVFRVPEVARHYSDRVSHILVDEYQDVNPLEYRIVKLLANHPEATATGKPKDLFVVGDDAQAIYGFRGADFRNILNFKNDWPDAKMFFLTQNYRSTQSIVDAARRLITYNELQQPKDLWTANDPGDPIRIIVAEDEVEEARLIAEFANRARQRGERAAVLYRVNHLSRPIEEALIKRKVPYQIFGGFRFYERKEVKDLVAYLRFLANPDDSVSLRRIVNTPARGIGEKTQKTFFSFPEERRRAILLGKESYAPLQPFISVIRDLENFADCSLPEFITIAIGRIGQTDSMPDERAENVYELVSIAETYRSAPFRDALRAFLEHVALFGETDTYETDESVKLLTLHLAKGLEFDSVWIAGFEEGIVPHWKHEDARELEEERRLLYVGVTRARRSATLSFARSRRIFGKSKQQVASRFAPEIISEDEAKHLDQEFALWGGF